MTLIYNSFRDSRIDKGVDIDGHFGWQCWDGYADYCNYLKVPYANCTVSGYVKDIWEQRKSNGILKYFDEIELLEKGDIVVFKEVAGVTPVSHIAIFDRDLGNGYGLFLGQNQLGKYENPKGGSSFNLAKLPYSATYPTSFRLKKDKINKGGAVEVNGDIYSNLITVARSEVFWAGGQRPLSSIKYIVIHGTATTNIVGAYSTWLRSRNNQTSAHYLVTPDDIMGCVGENYIAWHSGGVSTITNNNSIGIEHINSYIGNYADASTYLFDEKTINNGAKLVAEICKRLGLVPNHQTIVPHRDVSATACPQTLNMDDYIKKVQYYYNNETSENRAISGSNNTIGGQSTMDFTFKVKGDKKYNPATIHYYDNAKNEIVALSHPDQVNLLRQIFKDNNGRDLPHYEWQAKAPWYNRFIQVKKPKFTKAD